MSRAAIAPISEALQQARSTASRPNLRVILRILDHAQSLERRAKRH